MAKSNGILTETDGGPQALTPVEAHWFSPILTDGGGNTVVSGPYTTDYDGGAGPYDVTLTDTDIGADDVARSTVPIASYATGYNFHIASATLANGDKDIFYDKAFGTYPRSRGVGIDVQTVDSEGNPIGAPVTLLRDVQNVRQFRVGSAALGGDGYVLTWATVNPTTEKEAIHYQGYEADNTPIAGESGILASISTTGTGASYGFATLRDAGQADPSFIYSTESNDNFAYPNNVAVVYETVSTTGRATSGLTTITPPYPAGSTSPDLLNFSFERLTPATPDGNDLAVILRYSYVDASGTTRQALDVHTLNAETGVGKDHVIGLASGDADTDLTQTILANGDLAVGYDDGSSHPFKVQVFDTNGNAIGAPLALPNDEAGFQLDANSAGQLIVEWKASAGSGEQLDYDVYDVDASARTVDLQPFDDIFNRGRGDTQFVFSPGDGLDVIHGFRVGGAHHDTLELPSSDFRNLADVLRHTGDVGGSAFITDPVTGDAIRLAGVTTAELKAHPKDIAFHA